ncbi:MAG: hypothetical protein LBG72_01175 [Spirochaetaceae bacterium]|jgi:hypothetical protein|nr:hypothetical protein [Spirochaetaceae bacterium]
MKRKVFFLLTLLSLIPARKAAAQGNTPALPDSIIPYETPAARIRAYGGFHAAYADDLYALFSNPAALADINEQVSYAELSANVVDFNLFSLFLDKEETASSKFAKQAELGLQISADVSGPLAIGKVKPNWGWGFFNVSRLSVRWGGLDGTKEEMWYAYMRASEELLWIGAYGFRMFDTGTLTGDLGFSVKTFYRLSYVPRVWLQMIKSFLEGISKDPFESQLGIGVSIGAVFTAHDVFSFSLVVHDPFSPVYTVSYRDIDNFYKQEFADNAVIPLTARPAFGIAWKPDMTWSSYSFSSFVLMADITNIIEFLRERGIERFRYVSAGVEITLLEVFSMRAGIDGLSPAFGLGFDFTKMKLDLAFYIREIGDDFGDFSVMAGTVSILWRY